MNIYKLEVSKTVKQGEKSVKEKLGTVDVAYPTLKELGIDAEPTKHTEEGLPVYATDLENFVFTSVMERVKGMARNKLVSGTLELKPGASIATTLEDIVKPSVAGGNAETLKAIAELKRSFKEYLASVGVADKGQTALLQMFGSPAGIAIQSEAMRAKVASRVEGFAAVWMDSENANAAGEAYLDKVLAACTESEELDLDDF